MGVSDLATIRGLSEVMFGQRYRLELMIAIAEDDTGLVCLTELAAELGITTSNLQNPLRALARAGLISPLPKGDSRRRFYRRNPSRGWSFAQELVAAAPVLAIASRAD